MTRHPLDHRADSDTDAGDDVDRFHKLDQQQAAPGGHPTAKALHQRPRAASDRRVSEFARIDRGKKA